VQAKLSAPGNKQRRGPRRKRSAAHGPGL
jgi:hypothetical protein